MFLRPNMRVMGYCVVALTIELDLAIDPSELDADLDRFTKDIDVVHRIVKVTGLGGGWPSVQFTGRPEAIEQLIERYEEGNSITDPTAVRADV